MGENDLGADFKLPINLLHASGNCLRGWGVSRDTPSQIALHETQFVLLTPFPQGRKNLERASFYVTCSYTMFINPAFRHCLNGYKPSWREFHAHYGNLWKYWIQRFSQSSTQTERLPEGSFSTMWFLRHIDYQSLPSIFSLGGLHQPGSQSVWCPWIVAERMVWIHSSSYRLCTWWS